MCDKWSYGFTTNHLLSFVNLPSHHQFFETWIMVRPFGTLLSMLIIARESPSTINGFHWCCKAQYTPLMRPSTPNKLWVLVPMLPQNMVRILSGEFLIAPPKPTGPRFPFPAPLKLILKSPTRGHCQKSKVWGVLIIFLGCVFFTGTFNISHLCRIYFSIAFAAKSSCVHGVKFNVSFKGVSIIAQISSTRLYLFSKFFKFYVFEIFQNMKPRNRSETLLTILFLNMLFGHSTIIKLGLYRVIS